MKKQSIMKILLLIVTFLMIFAENNEQNSYSNSTSSSILFNPYGSTNNANSRPLVISQFAKIQDQFFSPILPSNVSFTLQNGWAVQNSTILYDGVSQRKNYITNGGLNSSQTGWTFVTNAGSDFTNSYYSTTQSSRITLSTNNMNTYGYGYIEQSFSITEPFSSDKVLTFSADYNLYPGYGLQTGAELSLEVKIGTVAKSYNISFTELYQNTWKKLVFSYDPIEEGQIAPGLVKIHCGVWIPVGYDADKSNYLYFDNIELKCWTKANQSNLIVAKDVDSNTNFSYQNSSYGTGYSYIPTPKQTSITRDYYFTIIKNTTSTEIDIMNVTIEINLEKRFNSTYQNDIGCFYSIDGNQTKWTTDIMFTNPSTYYLTSIEIEKPTDWYITHIWDSYRTDQISLCIGSNFGSNKIIIPISVYVAGIWTLDALSYNYLEGCDLLCWNGESYENRSNFYMNNRMQIKVFLNESISLINTLLNLTIFSPNSSIFYQESQEASILNTFGDFYIGLNMSTGSYQILLEWVNNASILGLDKIGYLSRSFSIIHNTSLTPLETNYVKYGNEPFLLKLNYSDVDTAHPIELASLTYNCSDNLSGEMIYIGSGIYAVDINTGNLGLGTFTFSFNASKTYYTNQTLVDAVTLTIVPDRLALQVPRVVQNFEANNFAYFEFNITGALYGDFLTPANITTDWVLPYSINDWNNGTYGLNLSTYELTTTGVQETFAVTIFANKTNYGYDSNTISFTVIPVAAEITLNQSMFETYLLRNFSIFVNYTNAKTNEIISNPICIITWESEFHIIPHLNGFICELSTLGLSSDYFTGYIEFKHNGFQSVKKPFFIFIRPINASVDLNKSLFEIYVNHNFSLSLNYTNVETNELISDANCFLSWGSDYQVINIDGRYKIEISSQGLSPDYYVGYVELSRSGFETVRKSFYVFIKPLKTTMQFNQSLFDIFLLDNLSIFVNYTNLQTGELIPDALCTVTWASDYHIMNFNGGYQIDLSTINLGTDYYVGYVELSHIGYETIRNPFNVMIKPIKTSIIIYNSEPMRFIKGDLANISCNLIGKSSVLNSANLTFIGLNLNSRFTWDDNCYSFTFDTSNLSIRSYFIQILASGENLETNMFDVVFEIVPLLLKFEVSESFITILNDKNNAVNSLKFRVLDQSHGQYRTDLSISYIIHNENFITSYSEDGFYVIYFEDLNLNPSNEPYPLDLFAINPYGENATIQIRIFMPIPDNSKQNQRILYASFIVLAIALLSISSFMYKKNFTDLTKFQRDIRVFKKSLLNKQPIKTLPEVTRTMLILMSLKKNQQM